MFFVLFLVERADKTNELNEENEAWEKRVSQYNLAEKDFAAFIEACEVAIKILKYGEVRMNLVQFVGV